MITLDHLDLDPSNSLAELLLESDDVSETLRQFGIALLTRRIRRNETTIAAGLHLRDFGSVVECYKEENARLTDALKLLENKPEMKDEPQDDIPNRGDADVSETSAT